MHGDVEGGESSAIKFCVFLKSRKVWIEEGYGFGGRRVREGYMHREPLEMAGATRI